MAAFIPGASPPEVSSPTQRIAPFALIFISFPIAFSSYQSRIASGEPPYSCVSAPSQIVRLFIFSHGTILYSESTLPNGMSDAYTPFPQQRYALHVNYRITGATNSLFAQRTAPFPLIDCRLFITDSIVINNGSIQIKRAVYPYDLTSRARGTGTDLARIWIQNGRCES